MGAKLLQDVRQDLADVVQVCEGKKKQTNYLRTLINELVKGAPSLRGGRGQRGPGLAWCISFCAHVPGGWAHKGLRFFLICWLPGRLLNLYSF